ncbi:MAG: pyridoxal phosphate-dependent aminotransferase [Nitrospinota bacterium]|nr:pyridoxal phosphate-dependent aminotransferase [Nitrospinota bacterium]MDH5757748.1 pyridoxal phosphate-dependent aminotransferase [Nitrospinota bacterium]
MKNIALSQRVGKIKPSATMAITAKAKALKAEGVDVVGFGAGEPDFDTPDFVKEAAIDALRAGKTKYTPGAGIPELRDALCQSFRQEEGLEYKREETIISSGGKHALYNIFQAILSDGDEVIIPIPYWVSFPDQVLLAGGTPVFLHTNEAEGFSFSVEDLEKLITPKTRAMVINSPSNPSGAVLGEELLRDIAKLAVEKDIYIIWDEIYKKINYSGQKLRSLPVIYPEGKSNVLVCGGLSKAFSMTGWRIGWTLGDARVINAMSMIQDQSTSNPTSFAQYGALAALRQGTGHIGPWLAAFKERRDILLEGFARIEGVSCARPEGAFYVFPNISCWFGKRWEKGVIKDSHDAAAYLLDYAKVAVVPGEPFGSPENIRLSYALATDDVRKGMERIAEAARALRP